MPDPVVSLLIILLPGALVVLIVGELFTARTSCVSSHNFSTWNSGCINLTGCE